MSILSSPRLRAWGPHLVVALWLAFLGATVWWHAARSAQAPLWDPHSYVVKAKHFWDCMAGGGWCNPLNLQPTARPPGTIALSYPFGFTPDFTGFHFRSVYLPVLCVALAPYLTLGWPRAFAWGWGSCATVLLFTSMPMFYHFEWTRETLGTGGWGMMDGFLSGAAALAGALILASLATTSLARLAGAAAFGAFTLFIKPAGAMVMVLLAGIWVFLAATNFLSRRPDGSGVGYARRYVLPGAALLFGVFAAAALLARSSGYLSAENFDYARKALDYERTLPRTSVGSLLASLRLSSGVFLPLWSGAILVLCVRTGGRVAADREVRPGLLLVCALATLVAGAWYWLVVQVLATQVRYFWPFVSLAAVCLLPVAWRAWMASGTSTRRMLAAVCALPAAMLALLLPLNRPPAALQRLAGVHLEVGTTREAEDAARAFLAGIAGKPGMERVYTFSSDIACAVFEHTILHELLVSDHAKAVRFVHAYDWIRGFVIRTGDILSADLILFAPEREPARHGSGAAWTGSFDDENRAFIAWFTEAGERDGLRTEVDSPSVRLVRIADRPAFERSLERFVNSRDWRSQFRAENPRRWWSAGEVAAQAATGSTAVAFGGRYLVRKMALSRSGETLTIDLWWEAQRPDPQRGERSWFFHLLDPGGKIVAETYLPVHVAPPPDPGEPVRLEQVRVDLGKEPSAVAVGFGIYAPKSGRLLQADGGKRDWSGRRVLLPLGFDGAPGTEPARADARP